MAPASARQEKMTSFPAAPKSTTYPCKAPPVMQRFSSSPSAAGASVTPSPPSQGTKTPQSAVRKIFTPSPPKVPPPRAPPPLSPTSPTTTSPPKTVQVLSNKSGSSPQGVRNVFAKRADVHPLPANDAVQSIPLPTAIPRTPTPPAQQRTGPEPRTTFCLSDFTLGVTLGTGSFGRVHFARIAEPRTEQEKQLRVAVKMLKKTSVVRQNQVEHTKHERAILQAIGSASWNAGQAPWAPKAGAQGHPFIVKMFASFQDAARLYIILEYVRGGEFFSHLRRRGHLKNHQAVFVTASVASVFAFLHAGDIAYRDLKPENLLLDHEGYVKVTDFGFAKRVEDKTYTLCGTPEYIAPEVLLNKGHGRSVECVESCVWAMD